MVVSKGMIKQLIYGFSLTQIWINKQGLLPFLFGFFNDER